MRNAPLRAVVVSCVFPPEPVVSSRTSFDVAQELSRRGHHVTVIAPFPNRPAGKLYAGYRRSLFRRERSVDGFEILRCGSFFSRRSSLLSRLAENVSFGITSAMALAVQQKSSVIYANTWPLFASAMLTAIARLRRIPMVVSVQDIFPESLQSQRRAGSNLAGRALAALDRWIARRAAAIVVISERFAEHYRRRRGVEAARIHVVPNWMPAKPADESPDAAEACRQRHGISRDALLLVYGGNVGVSAAVETVIPVLEQVGDVHLLIAGEGASLDLCRRLAARVAPDRIHFESPWTDTMGVLHAADIVVLPTRANQSATSVPSKLISYFLSARPVIAVALDDSDTASAVRDAGAGVVVRPDDPGALAEAIRAMSQLTAAERSSMGRAGLAWAKANMTAEACLPRLAEIIEQVSR